jgi:phage repressor protein C with HTH and peptisase S24 domain
LNTNSGQRLKYWRDTRDLSQRALASSLGVSQGYVGNIEAGRSEPSRRFLQKLSERFGVSADWLLGGTGEMTVAQEAGFEGRKEASRIEPADLSKPLHGDFLYEGEDFVLVKRMELSVSAGRGLLALEDGQRDAIAFSRSWMMRHHVTPDLAVLVAVKGDSMAPTIPDGAMILIDCMDKNIATKGIFAFSVGDECFVKRLSPSDFDAAGVPRRIKVISDNPAYPPDALMGDDLQELRLVGRVKCVVASL